MHKMNKSICSIRFVLESIQIYLLKIVLIKVLKYLKPAHKG